MSGGDMPRNEQNIPLSAKYTAATWRWAGFQCADVTEPEGAQGVFKAVNAYMSLYGLINPKMYTLKHMLVQRHTMINELLEAGNYRQVIEIASGFSPRGSEMSGRKAIDYFELDLPEVIAHKRNLLEGSTKGKEVVARNNWHIEVGDVLTLDLVSRFQHKPSFVITEGLMMYFSRAEQMAIWQRIAAFLKMAGGQYVFDYIPLADEPERSALGLALRKVKKSFSRQDLGFSYDERDRYGIQADLIEAGFTRVDILDGRSHQPPSYAAMTSEKTPVLIFKCQV